MTLHCTVNRRASRILAGTRLTADHVADTIAYPGRITAVRFDDERDAGMGVTNRLIFSESLAASTGGKHVKSHIALSKFSHTVFLNSGTSRG